MIVEFRTVDYAMESCELSLVTPHETSANFTLSGEVNILDVWQLTTQYPLDAKTLSWKTRPECTRKIVSIAVGRGTNYTHRFPCPPDSLQTFQFSAGNNWTHVEWLQDHTDAIPGIDSFQYFCYVELIVACSCKVMAARIPEAGVLRFISDTAQRLLGGCRLSCDQMVYLDPDLSICMSIIPR